MEGSLVPANTKKSILILGMYKLFPDLIILGSGIIITIILLLVFQNAGTLLTILMCLPMLTGIFLTIPIDNYHNVMGAIQSIIGFYNGRRKYIWRGWCIKYELEHNEQ